MYLKGMVVILISGCAHVFAQTYDDLAEQLKAASEPSDIHGLKARVAHAAMDRLESENLSKSATQKLKSEVAAYCADVQLGAMDLWYGDSVVSYGRLILLEGDWAEARSVLMSQAEVLENIEKNLAANAIPVSSISPLAGCRYVLGETYRLEHEKSGELKPAVEALKHYYNAYIKYGDSPWGGLAQDRVESLTELFKSEGRRVRVELGEHRATFIKSKFAIGARLAAEEEFEKALEAYDEALNLYAESSKSAQALKNVGTCQLNLGRGEDVMATVEYLCERFASDTNAPSAVLGIGREYMDAGLAGMGEQVFTMFLSSFPADDRRSSILSYFAWKAYKAELWDKALSWFAKLEQALRDKGEIGAELEKVVYIQASRSGTCDELDAFVEEFSESDLVPSALGKKAEVQLVNGAFDEAFATLEQLGRQYPESSASRTALSGLIVAAVEAERFDIAEQVLDRMLKDRTAYGLEVYLSTGEGLLMSGQYTLAEKAFSAVPDDAERVFAERACIGICKARFGRECYEDALSAIEDTLNVFPDTGWFYELRLMQARAMVKLGQGDEAVVCYSEVLAGGADCSVRFEMAEVLCEPEAQLAAYQRIVLLGDPKEEGDMIAASIIASLPLCLELGKYQLALDNCEQFRAAFPEHQMLPKVSSFRKEAADALVQ
jgi:tetratricopeptide (TPR) repeat protein